MTVTSISPNGSAVTRTHPTDDTQDSGGGGGGGDTTNYISPYVIEGPWEVQYFGDLYETGENDTFFTATAPVSETTF